MPVDYILKKVFRKDGPPLGVKFDPLPPGAFHSTTTGQRYGLTCAHNQRLTKKRKISKSPISHLEVNTKKSVSLNKHGMGKGLMTVWRATNPGARSHPTGVNITDVYFNSASANSTKPLQHEMKKKEPRKLSKKQGRVGNKLLEKRKRAKVNAKVSSSKADNPKESHQAECKLALEGLRSQEYHNGTTKLVDDEELELRELQAGPNPLTCTVHLASNALHTCSLCKDLLARFPPQSVMMKQPLCVQPWGSSPELVKKLFKVFRFLYSCSDTFDIGPFTLDEFAQAFHDKDSLLLGKIHVTLLKLLFSDVGMALSSGFLSHASKDYRFLGFLHTIKEQEFILKLWNRCLNPITWIEILRQVLLAAGFNSKQRNFRRIPSIKEDNLLAEYGLRPGTLKGEMFSILSEQGNNGMKVLELAKDFRVVELHLTNSAKELELLIRSTLSSDITLFEKISPSTYRLRSNLLNRKGSGDYHSDSEDSGSIDGASGESITNSCDESELDSSKYSLGFVKHKQHSTKKSNALIEYNEIDETDSGELWLLALMEGEYSELSVEEKMNTLVALVDLASAGSSIRVEAPESVTAENLASSQHHGGAKIKRSVAKQKNFFKPFWGHSESMDVVKEMDAPPGNFLVESSQPLKHRVKWNGFKKNDSRVPDGSKTNATESIEEAELDTHPLQSICLGSDRRFNSYWLFLGPCNAKDPGHRRIYFESSEDGHWEVIDTKEVLHSLLSVLDGRGSREACLLATLTRLEGFLCEAMCSNITSDNDMRQSAQSDRSSIGIISGDGSSPISEVDNNLNLTDKVDAPFPSSGAIVLEIKRVEEQRQKWDRLQAFDAWIWTSFYCNLNAVKHCKGSYVDSLVRCASCHDLYWRDEKHCKICHATFELDFDLEERYAVHVATCREKEGNNMFPKHKVLPTQLQSLKAALHAIEGVMPKEALVSAWTTSDHKLWIRRLRRTTSLLELLQVLTDFVGAINESWLCQCSIDFDCHTALDEIIESFPTIPQTTSAVALWLVKLDASFAPHLKGAHCEQTHGKTRNNKVTS
ncbi:Homeobox-ddt domain protein rlt3 [Thalictrum thalictroides]|uniref:Homeobox-ddt domain protein rlt3 n=1 Tax=Thalictrum thalictroides TaxID=46969 RepID=A0A7J6VD90_THATH|nr:Homeobox-ddt domain protein rlt3 [Thalictrum thalictroides]